MGNLGTYSFLLGAMEGMVGKWQHMQQQQVGGEKRGI
jgi:hypothetical protein